MALARVDGEIIISVNDDGRGFDAEQPEMRGKGGHYGMDFMADRMAQIGGSLTIESRLGAGTRVLLRSPVRERGGEKP